MWVVRTFPPPPKAPARLAEASRGREGGRSAVSGEPKGSHYFVSKNRLINDLRVVCVLCG